MKALWGIPVLFKQLEKHDGALCKYHFNDVGKIVAVVYMDYGMPCHFQIYFQMVLTQKLYCFGTMHKCRTSVHKTKYGDDKVYSSLNLAWPSEGNSNCRIRKRIKRA